MAKLKCLNCGEIFTADIKDHEHIIKPCTKCKSKFVKYFCADDVEIKKTIKVNPQIDFNAFMSNFIKR